MLARPKRSDTDRPSAVVNQLMALPPIPPRHPQVPTTLPVFVLSFLPSDTHLLVAKSPASTLVDQTRCTSKAMVRCTLRTRIRRTIKASQCTNNVIHLSQEPLARMADLSPDPDAPNNFQP